MKLFFIAVGFLMGIGISIAGYVHATQIKVSLCHATGSSSNPWVVIQVDASAQQTHLDDGDKVYSGPVKDNGHPDQKEGDEWCNQTLPNPNPSPTPSPEPKPTTPATTPTEGGEAIPAALPNVGAKGQ